MNWISCAADYEQENGTRISWRPGLTCEPGQLGRKGRISITDHKVNWWSDDAQLNYYFWALGGAIWWCGREQETMLVCHCCHSANGT